MLELRFGLGLELWFGLGLASGLESGSRLRLRLRSRSASGLGLGRVGVDAEVEGGVGVRVSWASTQLRQNGRIMLIFQPLYSNSGNPITPMDQNFLGILEGKICNDHVQ